MSDRRKTLLPELLPTPRQPAGATPRDRVVERARSMLDRLRGLKTTAGAAVLAAHCGYGVVDPLPPPPGQCADRSDPFASATFTVYGFATSTGGPPQDIVTLANYQAVGFRIDAVRVTAGGTLVSVEDMSHDGQGGQTSFTITIAPDGSGNQITIEVDLGCGAAATTKRYRLSPATNGPFVVTEG